MPRSPRRKKPAVVAAVIPTNSLVASATRYTGKTPRIYQPATDWQAECYRHFGICGEAAAAAMFYGHAMGRAELSLKTERGPLGQPIDSGVEVEYLNALFNGKDGQAQMLEAIGVHLTIAGDLYLVGRHVPIMKEDKETGELAATGETEELWEVVSVLEMKHSGTSWWIEYGDGVQPIQLADDDVIIRIWTPNPGRRIEAHSPFRSLLPILREIEWLTMGVLGQITSRLAGAGVLFLPEGIEFPPPPEVEGQPVPMNKAEQFMQVLGNAMMETLDKPDSPASKIPVVSMVPNEMTDKPNLMHFWSPLDENAMALRQEQIHRFALGMDLPPEQVEGMSSNGGSGGGSSNGISHWGQWQIEESTIKMHIEPKLELVVNALTIGYQRPLSGGTEVVDYDTRNLRLKPDRSKESMELLAAGVVPPRVALRENGFDADDLMTDEERKLWLTMKIASGSTTPEQVADAARMLGVDLTTPSDATPTEARPDPSLKDHPQKPRTPAEADASIVLALCEPLVFRALERAGNRLRANGAKPPNTSAFEVHRFVKATDPAGLLDDAWSCAPQVFEGYAVPADILTTLNAYVISLLVGQQAHDRSRLAEWIARAAVNA